MSGIASLFRIAASAVVTALLVAACAPKPEPDGEPEPAPNGDAPPTQEAPGTQSEIGPSTTLRLELGSASTAGEPIDFILTVLNEGAEELVIDFPDGQRFDFEVIGGGDRLWHWAADMFFTQMLGRERIGPGERRQWTATLESGLPAGTYTVRGTLTTNTRHALDLAFDVEGGGETP